MAGLQKLVNLEIHKALDCAIRERKVAERLRDCARATF